MRIRLTIIAIAAGLLLAFPFAAPAQTCSDTDQGLMDTCVGDAVDSCHGTYIYCKRKVQEVSDVLGLALEDCCCTNGERDSSASFRACRLNKLRLLTNASGLFSRSFYGPSRRSIRNMTYADCNFGCDF